ncbi:MAG: molybdopterin molybdotransferase MoeA [Actinobacteria bacterium]|nr:molybdopterin molybdotransferase MoeA [Actinomycetota bacterium]
MTTVDEHAAHIAGLVGLGSARPPVEIGLDDALGRVTSVAVLSPVDLPLFRNSQMDGFAVRSADLPGTLPIAGEVSARPSDPPALRPRTAVRIMTGAVVPEGADAVVPVEDTVVTDGLVAIERVRRPGEYVRDRGSDVHAGDELLPAGLRLASRHLAALAAAGITAVSVRAGIRVAVITTGSELVEPGATPVLGQVFDSNGTALAAAVRAAGATVASRVHVGDDNSAMLRALTDAAAHADLILTSGGISMGDYEVVRETLEPLGARVGTVAMQPGGPQATAVFEGVPVVCFPGNPVSTQVSFEVFVAPLLREAAGLPPARRETRTLVAALSSPPGKRQFLRDRAVGASEAALVAGPSSHLVAGLAASDLLVIVPEDVTALAAGDNVEVLHL